MYSMVLMMAMSTSADMPDFGRRGGGCCGCYGGGWGGCYGGGWGGCYGGCGMGGYGGFVVSAPTITPAYSLAPVVNTAVVGNMAVQPANATRSLYYNPDNASGERSATVIVHLPKNAKLYIDNKLSRNMASTRRFQTPPLAADQEFHYTLRAEMDRDGQPVTTSKTITVRAGQPTEVTMAFPSEE